MSVGIPISLHCIVCVLCVLLCVLFRFYLHSWLTYVRFYVSITTQNVLKTTYVTILRFLCMYKQPLELMFRILQPVANV